MPTALYRLILAGLLLLPWTAQAGDAEDFVAGNSGEQARLLETWAAQPDPARLELLNALQQGQLNIAGESRTLRLNNRLRGLIDSALASHQLLASDANSRLAAARQLQKSAKPAQLKFLDARLAAEQAGRARCPEPGPGQPATGGQRPGGAPGRRAPAGGLSLIHI